MFQNVEMRHQSHGLLYRSVLQKKRLILKQFALMFQNVEMRHQSHCDLLWRRDDVLWKLDISIYVQVSFAEYSLFYRALLQKRRIMLKGHHSISIWVTSEAEQLEAEIQDGVATISRLPKMIGLFCKRAL